MSETRPKYGENRPQYGEARPAPDYGEYATPDEQAKAAGLPLPSEAVAIPAPPTPGTAKLAPPPEVSRENAGNVDGAALRNTPNEAPGTTGRRPRRWDLILSLALLAYGAAGIVGSFSGANDLNAEMVAFYKAAGIGTYTPIALAASLGKLISIVSGVLFIITFAITAQLLRRGRLAFYVPLIGALLAGIVSAVCIFMVLAADPAAITNFTNR
jgi:hypothetical protein